VARATVIPGFLPIVRRIYCDRFAQPFRRHSPGIESSFETLMSHSVYSCWILSLCLAYNGFCFERDFMGAAIGLPSHTMAAGRPYATARTWNFSDKRSKLNYSPRIYFAKFVVKYNFKNVNN